MTNTKRSNVTKLPVNPENEVHTCSICGSDYRGFGNNAMPINDGRCCDPCNGIVIARRIADMQRRGAM